MEHVLGGYRAERNKLLKFIAENRIDHVVFLTTGSADGKSLAVDTWGIDSYLPNSFPEPSQVATPRRILGFRIEAE